MHVAWAFFIFRPLHQWTQNLMMNENASLYLTGLCSCIHHTDEWVSPCIKVTYQLDKRIMTRRGGIGCWTKIPMIMNMTCKIYSNCKVRWITGNISNIYQFGWYEWIYSQVYSEWHHSQLLDGIQGHKKHKQAVDQWSEVRVDHEHEVLSSDRQPWASLFMSGGR